MNDLEHPFKLDVVSVRMVKDAPIYSDKQLKLPEDVVALLGQELCDMDREVLCVINVKTNCVPINCFFASVGALNSSLAHPRELFKTSILSNAGGMFLLHNHPSGELSPSKEDTTITDRMSKLCELMGIPLLDHIIVGGDNSQYFSFKEKGILPIPKIDYEQDYRKLQWNNALVAEKGKVR